MRYHLHIAVGRAIDYDDEGAEFRNIAAARAHAIEFLRAAYMAPQMPPPAQLREALICISDSQGAIQDRVSFADAFRTNNGRPPVSDTAGTA